MKTRLVCLALVASVAGCGTTPREVDRVRPSAQPIIGGVVDPGDPAVVALTDSTGYYSCSATIVDSVHVVTAAHCLNEGDKPAYVFICADNYNDTGDECFLEVSGAVYNPAYGGESAHDIGVVTLARPTSIAPKPIPASSLPASAVGTPARIVGYGEDENGGDGVKRQANATIDEMDGSTFTMWGSPNHCYGDSGGPAFWPAGAADEALVGVTSAGTADACDQGGIDTMVGDNLDWLATVGVVSNAMGSGGDTSSSATSGPATSASSATTGAGVGVGGGDNGGGGFGFGGSTPEAKESPGADESSDGSCAVGRHPSESPVWLAAAVGLIATLASRKRSRRIARLQSAHMGVMQVNAANESEVSGSGMNDTTSLEKDVLAVVTATFGLE